MRYTNVLDQWQRIQGRECICIATALPVPQRPTTETSRLPEPLARGNARAAPVRIQVRSVKYAQVEPALPPPLALLALLELRARARHRRGTGARLPFRR